MLIEPIINTHKIKYGILTDLVKNNIEDGNKINIYINLDTIFSKFYSKNVLEGISDLRGLEAIALSSELINMAGHYRHFFHSRFNVSSKIFFYYSSRQPKFNASILPSYALDMVQRKSVENAMFHGLNEWINSNIQLMNTIIEYLPETYLLVTDIVEPSMVPYHLMKNHENVDGLVHLLLSKDMYDFQLLSMPNTYALRLKYDNSFMITKNNIYEIMCSGKDVKYKPSIPISPELYTFVLSVAGCRSRGLKGVDGCGYISTIKKIESLIENNKILNGYYHNISPLIKAMGLEQHEEEITKMFHTIDLRYQSIHLTPLAVEEIQNKLVDKFDIQSIEKLNDKYYPINPIDLTMIMEGVDYGNRRGFIW